MFNKYWRSYPWFFQLIQFIILIAVLASFFVFALTPVILHFFGVALNDIVTLSDKSPRNVINAALLVQFFSSVGIFLLPALLFAYFTHPQAGKYLGLVKPGKSIHWVLAIIVVLSATPIFLSIAGWISQIDFGASVKQAQADNDRMFGAFLNITSFPQLLLAIGVLALLPAMSEELFFRGIIMRFAAKRAKSIWFPLIVSATMFALLHSNVYGLLSIFLAGILLGGIYYLTGSIWCSMMAHMLYNGLQVVLSYGANHYSSLKNLNDTNEVPLSWLIIGIIVFSISFYFLWKNRTPLSKNWAEDYTPEELLEEQNSITDKL